MINTIKYHSNYFINISGAESDVSIGNVLTITGWLLIIWKSDLFDEIKLDIFQIVGVSGLHYGCTIKTLTKSMEKKVLWVLYKNAMNYFQQIFEAASHKTAVVW